MVTKKNAVIKARQNAAVIALTEMLCYKFKPSTEVLKTAKSAMYLDKHPLLVKTPPPIIMC